MTSMSDRMARAAFIRSWPVMPGHHEVGEDQVDGVSAHDFESELPRRSREDSSAVPLEQATQGFDVLRFIVDDQDRRAAKTLLVGGHTAA